MKASPQTLVRDCYALMVETRHIGIEISSTGELEPIYSPYSRDALVKAMSMADPEGAQTTMEAALRQLREDCAELVQTRLRVIPAVTGLSTWWLKVATAYDAICMDEWLQDFLGPAALTACLKHHPEYESRLAEWEGDRSDLPEYHEF